MVQLRKQYTCKKESLQHVENVYTSMKHSSISVYMYVCLLHYIIDLLHYI